jgi:hypothetical protein
MTVNPTPYTLYLEPSILKLELLSLDIKNSV